MVHIKSYQIVYEMLSLALSPFLLPRWPKLWPVNALTKQMTLDKDGPIICQLVHDLFHVIRFWQLLLEVLMSFFFAGLLAGFHVGKHDFLILAC